MIMAVAKPTPEIELFMDRYADTCKKFRHQLRPILIIRHPVLKAILQSKLIRKYLIVTQDVQPYKVEEPKTP